MIDIYIDKKKVEGIVMAALKEDIGAKDITSVAIVGKGLPVKAHIVSKEEGIICGLPVCEKVFNVLDANIRFKPQLKDGGAVHEGQVAAYLEGEAVGILSGERAALNFLARLSGIATKTNAFIKKIGSLPVKIMDTRKTTPGLRYLEKYAVRIGGGYNHRSGLWDQVLIKDNHLKAISCQPSQPKAGPPRAEAISKLLENVRKKVQRNIKIEIEVNNLKEFENALKGKPDIIMLDNMSAEDAKKAVKLRNKSGKYPLLEISGNITLENVLDYAECKVDMISIGSLTHSVESIDLSLEIDATI